VAGEKVGPARGGQAKALDKILAKFFKARMIYLIFI